MKHLNTAALLLLAGCVTENSSTDLTDGSPESALDRRVSRSFSPLAINSSVFRTTGLRHLEENECPRSDECDFADAEGVRHFYYENRLVVKAILASEFAGRDISALGIGSARTRSAVLRNVSAFVPTVDVTCEGETPGPVRQGGPQVVTQCDGQLERGWFRLWFDAQDQLVEVRFDGYHFT